MLTKNDCHKKVPSQNKLTQNWLIRNETQTQQNILYLFGCSDLF
jgi:hypothetical protein